MLHGAGKEENSCLRVAPLVCPRFADMNGGPSERLFNLMMDKEVSCAPENLSEIIPKLLWLVIAAG